jgi:hypothetical protein
MQILRFPLVYFLAALTAFAAPVAEPSHRLPTTPAEVAGLLAASDAAVAAREALLARRAAAKNEYTAAFNALKNGPFKQLGEAGQASLVETLEAVTSLEALTKLKREALAAAEKAGETDEKAALEIESSRLRVLKDAAQAALEKQVLDRCLAAPEVKPAAETVETLRRKAQAAEDALTAHTANRLEPLRELAAAYRQEAPGVGLTKTRPIILSPPADAAERREAFRKRNTPAALEALAHRLFAALDEKQPALKKPFALYKAKKHSEALTAFRDYFCDKIAHLEKHRISPESILTDATAPLAPWRFPREWAEDALRGVATMSNRFAGREALFKAEVGPPGAVNWTWLPAEPGTPREQPETLHLARAFHLLESEGEPNGLLSWLLQGYQAWGERAYLQRWAEYADDWALNVQRDLSAVPAAGLDPSAFSPSEPLPWNLRYYSTLVPRVLAGFVTRLRAIVLERPESVAALPAPTLARVLLTALEEYATPNILVARSTRFNWNMMGLSFNIRNSLLLGEFKTGQWLGREATRTLLNHALFSILPDGGYVEYSDEGHQGAWREFGGAALELLTKHKPAWFDPLLESELRASLSQNATFWLRHLKPDGHRHRDSYRDAAPSYVGRRISAFAPTSLDAQTPWVTTQAEPARLLDTVFGAGANGAPAHRSDVLPYLGEFLLRGGWGRRDPFLYMHSGHIPNSNPDEDCNAFKLHDFGHHLLTAQPVYVDGRTQNQHAEMVDNPGAKTAFVSVNNGSIGRGRWHSSDSFDFAEGVYSGVYEERPGRTYWSAFQTGGFDMKRRQRSVGKPPVEDVHHVRQVLFVRKPAAWIVVDRVRSARNHQYEFPYELYTPVDRPDWLRRLKVPIPNGSGRVVIDRPGKAVHTHNPGFPALSLRHFGSSPLSIEFDPNSHELNQKDTGEIRDAEAEWKTARADLRDRLAFVRRTLVKWSGSGEQLLVTLITTAPEGGMPANTGWSVQGEGTAFSATAPDGSKLHFAASTKRTPLSVAGVEAQADTILVVEPSSGNAGALVLSTNEVNARGRLLRLPSGAAELKLGAEPAAVRAIYPMLSPVAISPGVNVFADSVEVTMQTDNPASEIRYTLDGSEPTPQSTRYAGPVLINKTTVVHAIAVRPGAGELRWPLDPGYATLPTLAVFTKQAPAPAQKKVKLSRGLVWEYTPGQAFALTATSGFVAPRKHGTTDTLPDVSFREGGDAFTARYTGFIDVPATGVYTFYAPSAYVIPNQEPGYDLRVFVDDEEWWPTMRWHALGTWSRVLAEGPHRFQVIYTDTRTAPFKHETWMNWPNPALLWEGSVPALEVSFPGSTRRPLPAEWLKHALIQK